MTPEDVGMLERYVSALEESSKGLAGTSFAAVDEIPRLLRELLGDRERLPKLEAALRESKTYADHVGRCVDNPDPTSCNCGMFAWEDRVKTLLAECQHEFGALGAVSGDYCIHCGMRQAERR